ncbi:nuclear pore complex protein Nup107 [Patella vulgata]|uniref:nuclear pore complex protein Nup107 n=1 Tax=Patella vulgata TaxID=6465 RepID=UPI00217F45F3|nr:nuclear pore complex protein Nup107 [Patella vulgata]
MEKFTFPQKKLDSLFDDKQKEQQQQTSTLPKPNFQKSLKLLDEAVSSPVYSQRFQQTPKSGILRNTSFTPKYASPIPGPKFDLSAIGASPGGYGLQSESMITNYMSQGHHSQLNSMLAEDITTTNVSLLIEDDPGLAASSGVYRDFYECIKSNPSNMQVFELMSDCETVCTDQVLLLKKLVNRTTRNTQQKLKKTYDTLELLYSEKCTWQLLRSLYKDRLSDHDSPHEEKMVLDTPGKIDNKSDEMIIDELFEKTPWIRQAQLVIDWLESSSLDNLDMFSDNVQFFSDQAVAWENTLHALKRKKEGRITNTTRAFVDELDPDAPIRQNKSLDDLDKEDELRLLQHMFVCIRAGQLEKAQEVCRNCGQSWRAATLEGWRPFHDSNYQKLGEGGQVESVQGNQYRDIWKLVCWRMSKEGKFSPYEKGIYGIMSGNLGAVLPVCKTWQDYLWGYFKVMVDTQVEREVRMSTTSPRSFEDLPQEYWDRLMKPEQVFSEIEASLDEKIQQESRMWFNIIQKYIILGDIGSLIEVMFTWIQADSKRLPQHLIRFMAHLVLILRKITDIQHIDKANTILETYIEILIKNNNKQLVAFYVSNLPKKSQINWYAKFLEGIEDKSERQHVLRLAEDEDLDIPLITKTVVENIRHREGSGTPSGTDITDEDREKIEAIDWLVFDPKQRGEAVKQANAVMRSFIAVKKHDAAKEVFNKLPVDTIDIIIRQQTQAGSEMLKPDVQNAVREYMCIKAYLDAVDGFNDWFTFFHHAKPQKPNLTMEATFTDKVAYEHRIRQYETELDRWRHNLTSQTKISKERIYNILLFTDGGWMVDKAVDDTADDGRKVQMDRLRELHIPGLCFNLHHMLHSTEMYADCLQLADYIASEQYRLYKEFSSEDLKTLLRHLQESSLKLLDKNKDPLGYELV